MANENIDEVYTANPITSNAADDLIYVGQSPYSTGNDAAITFSNFSAQFTTSTLTQNNIFLGNNSNKGVASTITAALDTVFGSTQGSILYRNASEWVVLTGGFAGQYLTTQGNGANPFWGGGYKYSLQVPTTGFSITLFSSATNLLLNPAGTLASGTVTFPSGAIDQEIVRISTTQTITSLTLTPVAGDTILNSVTTLVAGQECAYIYDLSSTTWFPLSQSSFSGWSTGSGTESAYGGGASNGGGNYGLAWGGFSSTESGSTYCVTIGYSAWVYGNYDFAMGNSISVDASTNFCFAFGSSITINSNVTNGFGFGTGILVTNTGSVVWGDSNATPPTDTVANSWNTCFAGGYNFYLNNTPTVAVKIDTSGNLRIPTVGTGLAVAEGSNAKQGTATLASGTVVVANTSVTASSKIFLTIQSPSGTVGSVYISTRIGGTSFTITSTSALDNSVVGYEIFEPA